MLLQISVDRGLKWDEAYARSLELTGTHDGFYLSYKVGGWAAARPLGARPQWGAGQGRGREGSSPHLPASCARPPAQVRGNKLSCLLAEQNRGKHFTVYKPNVGRQSQLETFDSLCRKFRRVPWGSRGVGLMDWGAARGVGAPVPPVAPDGPSRAVPLAARSRRSRPGAPCTGGTAVQVAHEAACPQVTAEEAREHWENSYAFSLTHCSHTAW